MKRALITGITGQDGSYLAEHLLDLGYEVHGLIRRSSTGNKDNIRHIENKICLHPGDITDIPSLVTAIDNINPHEIYNLAAQSFVGDSWTYPILTMETTGVGALNIFEAALNHPFARIYQASSSEMFSGNESALQNEKTQFNPRSIYGVAKLMAHKAAKVYRESYGQYIACGILFNHESPRRGIEFVTQKIVDAVVRQCVCGMTDPLLVGNVLASRDWSHARDMVVGMHAMLQEPEPDDFVLASGNTIKVLEFINKCYACFNVDLHWGRYQEMIIDEVSFSDEDHYETSSLPFAMDDQNIVRVKCVPEFYRPNEVSVLIGDATKARTRLGWTPKYNIDDLIFDMVESRIAYYA